MSLPNKRMKDMTITENLDELDWKVLKEHKCKKVKLVN